MRELSHCALTFDGHLLDEEIESYMTVNVEGRQLLSRKLETVNVPGRDGDIIIGGTYPPREITVHFMISDYRNVYFLEKIRRLNEILYTDNEVAFKFDDEDGYRIGRLSSTEDPAYDSNLGFGKFTIHCADPFMYGYLRKTNSKIDELKLKKYPIKIEEIKIVAPGTNKLVVTNKNKGTKIILNGEFKAGDEVIIAKDKITVNGQNRMYWLDFVNSDYQNFELYSEDEVILLPNSNFEIKYRERSL
ncbi:distal tail protein Dit [uncultured Peptoniphilus sp.]|uniref:distal tail protein Dit n=1 Tax=uncultured Peptoniphilus sp. TaxID=254354 RepID=UPI0028055E5D|nr:distal tail protein Dit [uncultured Peptoniphilus sp.]